MNESQKLEITKRVERFGELVVGLVVTTLAEVVLITAHFIWSNKVTLFLTIVGFLVLASLFTLTFLEYKSIEKTKTKYMGDK